MTPAIRRTAGRDAAGMPTAGAGAHGSECEPAQDRHWCYAIRCGPVAELPGVVHAPAVNRASVGDTAGVTRPGAQRPEAESTADRHRSSLANRGAVAELTVSVVAPTVGCASRRDAAGVIGSGADCPEAQPAHDAHGYDAAGVPEAFCRPSRPVAELAVLVEAPAVRPACDRDAAREQVSDAHGGKRRCARNRERHVCRVARDDIQRAGIRVVGDAVGRYAAQRERVGTGGQSGEEDRTVDGDGLWLALVQRDGVAVRIEVSPRGGCRHTNAPCGQDGFRTSAREDDDREGPAPQPAAAPGAPDRTHGSSHSTSCRRCNALCHRPLRMLG